MTAKPYLDSTSATAAGPFDQPAVELGRWSVGTLVGLLGFAAVLVGWRRLAGALDRPLEPRWLLFVGAVVAGAGVGVRIGWRRLAGEYQLSRLPWMVAFLPTAAALVFGAAVSLPGTNAGGLIVLWALLIGGELWIWWPVVWRGPRRARKATPARSPQEDRPPSPRGHPAATESLPAIYSLPTQSPPAIPAEDVLQQLTRSRATDGSEQLAGWLRVPFAPGQRTANVHVAFCPQFPKTPELAYELLDGPEVRSIKKVQLLTWGVRLDLKLAVPAEKPESVLLQFSARSTGGV